MDCLTTQHTLEQLRSGSSQKELPVEVEGVIPAPVAAEAQSHLVGCEVCQTVVARRLRFDARVGAAFRNVPVPMGLRERLVAAVQAAEAADSAESVDARIAEVPADRDLPPTPQAQPRTLTPLERRRRLMKQLTACMLLLTAGLAGWTWYSHRRLTLDQLVQATTTPTLDQASLVAYPLAVPPLPQDLWVPSTVDREPVRQLVVNGVPAAIRFFKVLSRKRVAIPVRLVAVPRNSLRPTMSAPNSARIAYVGSWAVWTWSEGNTQFVVALEGGEDELLRLIRHPNVI